MDKQELLALAEKALAEIAELTKRRQLPITNHINEIATEALRAIASQEGK